LRFVLAIPDAKLVRLRLDVQPHNLKVKGSNPIPATTDSDDRVSEHFLMGRRITTDHDNQATSIFGVHFDG
jgi:hypothetical protein